MKCYLVLLLISGWIDPAGACLNFLSDRPSVLVTFQMGPIYFVNPLPSRINQLERIDLSFMKSSLVTSCRYKLEIPAKGTSNIDKRLIAWSDWYTDDIVRILIPQLDLEGSYTLIVEYKTRTNDEIKRFEKQFLVNGITAANEAYSDSRISSPSRGTSIVKTTPQTETVTPNKTQAVNNSTANVSIKQDEKKSELTLPVNSNAFKTKLPLRDKTSDSSILGSKADKGSKIPKLSGTIGSVSRGNSKKFEKRIYPHIDSLIIAYSKKTFHGVTANNDIIAENQNLMQSSSGIKAPRGSDSINAKNTITDINKKFVVSNITDNYGNTPLHQAVLMGDEKTASILIDRGADPNILNKAGFSSLHLAVMRNDNELVKLLLKKGAFVNLRGNSGYTPLLVASELNNLAAAKTLLLNEAKIGAKTNQGLSSKTIARIQGNKEMLRMISRRGTDTIIPGRQASIMNVKINFSLPYDNILSRKRRSSRTMKFIAAPVSVIGAASFAYLRSEADHYYSVSGIAETERIARNYYDKATRLDKLSYVSGGISLISAYAYIHSAIKKSIVSHKMRKNFNQ